ncbi:MAG: hypothetical protein AB7S38_27685 [Vulcanimicrobiota bacterium]
MNNQEIIEKLEHEWESGFFAILRMKGFDQEGFRRVESLLECLNPNVEHMPQRLVALTWFIPLFMSWQEAPNISVEEYRNHVDRMEALVMKGLGVP